MRSAILAILLLSFNLLSAEGLYVKASLLLPSQMEVSSKMEDVKSVDADQELYAAVNYAFSVDYSRSFFDQFIVRDIEFGLGLAYEGEPRQQKGFEPYGFSMMPLYGLLRYNVYGNDSLRTWVSGKAGYDFVFVTKDNMAENDSSEGGFYWGVSVGIEAMGDGSTMFELSYSVSRAKFSGSDYTDFEDEYEYPKFAITIGRRFDLFVREKK